MIFFCDSGRPSNRRTWLIRLIGQISLFILRRALMAAFFHARTGFQHVLVNYNCKVTNDVLIELEHLLEFGDDIGLGLVKDLHVITCILLLDCVRETSSSPTIDVRYFAAVLGNKLLVARDYSLDLIVFKVGIDDKCCFVFSLNGIQFTSPPLVNLAVRR